jgi:Uma2 family endonuclease
MAASTNVLVAHDDEVAIPPTVHDLSTFRAWTYADDFPQSGRIDFVRGKVEVDMSPENVWFHSVPKSELAGVIIQTVKRRKLGFVGIDCTRIASVSGDLSAEPDLVFIHYDALRSGAVRLVPGAGKGPHDYIEIEGSPDLVVEIVSRSSVKKDMHRLPPAYFAAGVGEFWLVDVRPGQFLFQIHHRGDTGWVAATPREDGSQRSVVLDHWYRLDQEELPGGIWTYDLIESE